jgi:hypothetical protein
MNIPNPCGTTSGGQTKSTTNKEGQVECWSTSDDICSTTPDGCTQAKPYEQGAGGETNLSLRNTELRRDRW